MSSGCRENTSAPVQRVKGTRSAFFTNQKGSTHAKHISWTASLRNPGAGLEAWAFLLGRLNSEETRCQVCLQSAAPAGHEAQSSAPSLPWPGPFTAPASDPVDSQNPAPLSSALPPGSSPARHTGGRRCLRAVPTGSSGAAPSAQVLPQLPGTILRN